MFNGPKVPLDENTHVMASHIKTPGSRQYQAGKSFQ